MQLKKKADHGWGPEPTKSPFFLFLSNPQCFRAMAFCTRPWKLTLHKYMILANVIKSIQWATVVYCFDNNVYPQIYCNGRNVYLDHRFYEMGNTVILFFFFFFCFEPRTTSSESRHAINMCEHAVALWWDTDSYKWTKTLYIYNIVNLFWLLMNMRNSIYVACTDL